MLLIKQNGELAQLTAANKPSTTLTTRPSLIQKHIATTDGPPVWSGSTAKKATSTKARMCLMMIISMYTTQTVTVGSAWIARSTASTLTRPPTRWSKGEGYKEVSCWRAGEDQVEQVDIPLYQTTHNHPQHISMRTTSHIQRISTHLPLQTHRLSLVHTLSYTFQLQFTPPSYPFFSWYPTSPIAHTTHALTRHRKHPSINQGSPLLAKKAKYPPS